MTPITLGAIDLAGIANVTQAIPAKIVFPTEKWVGVVPLIDGNHIAIMGALAPADITPVAPIAPQPPAQLWQLFQSKFQATWTQQFPSVPLTLDGHIFVRTDFFASILNDTWNSANPVVSYATNLPMDASIPFYPTIEDVHKTCDLDCDTKYCTYVAGLKVCEPVEYAACNGLVATCEVVATGINIAAQLFTGDMDIHLSAQPSASVANTKLGIASSLESVSLDYGLQGGASFSGTVTDKPTNLSYFGCPSSNLEQRFPVDGTDIHLVVPPQQQQLSGPVQWAQTDDATHGRQFTADLNLQTHLRGILSPTPAEVLPPVMAQVAITCPINGTAFLTGVVSTVAEILKINGKILINTDLATIDIALRKWSKEYRLIADGTVDQDIKLPVKLVIPLPQLSVAGGIFTPSATINNGILDVSISHNVAVQHYSAGLFSDLDYGVLVERFGADYPVLGRMAADLLGREIAKSREVVSSKVSVDASASDTYGEVASLRTKWQLQLLLHFSEQEAEDLVGEDGVAEAIRRKWATPIKGPQGQLLGLTVPVSADCAGTFGAAVVISPLSSATLDIRRLAGLFDNCNVRGEFTRLADLRPSVMKLLLGALDSLSQTPIKEALGRLFPSRDGQETYQALLAQMPLLRSLVDTTSVGTSRCEDQGNPAWCLEVRFPTPQKPCADLTQGPMYPCLVDHYRGTAASASAHATGISTNLADQWTDNSHAFRCSSPGQLFKSFPSKTPDGSVCDDRESIFYNGLLCASGLNSAAHEGCSAVIGSQDLHGLLWRSPRMEKNGQPDGAVTNDDIVGFLLYVAQAKDKVRLTAWESAVLKSPTYIVGAGIGRSPLYRTCDAVDDERCIVFARDWYLANVVGKYIGLDPVPDAEVAASYGYDTAWLPYRASISPDGDRLHHLAAELFLLKRVGVVDANIADAARILSGRDPENAFYAWLNIGNDKEVQSLVEKYCPKLDAPVNAERTEWTWERKTDVLTPAGARSMYWECGFMSNLLSN